MTRLLTLALLAVSFGGCAVIPANYGCGTPAHGLVPFVSCEARLAP